MNIEINAYDKNDIAEAIFIWNEVVQDGVAFTQMDLLTENSGTPRQDNTAQRGYYSEATRRNSRAAKTPNDELSAVSSPRNRGEIYRAGKLGYNM